MSGENFGNDPSIVNVFVGGKKAIVINVKIILSTVWYLHRLIPEKSKYKYPMATIR
ncbi:hypothetical protein [Bacteroides thetaiotaomicron]|uniref:hypothetical protein n=1 Tax=Bacteroides thetaiotaomicron TaxID=818 RepID=UPI001F5BEE50|nr:hypothetical protein [Bacteroides thetaiotaomicron]